MDRARELAVILVATFSSLGRQFRPTTAGLMA
jgi:hypothetical protein